MALRGDYSFPLSSPITAMELKTKNNTKRTKWILYFVAALGFYLLFVIDNVDFQPDRVPRQLRNVEGPKADKRRPVMYTFFEPVEGGCCGMTQEAHEDLIKAWEDAWQMHGWDTKVLNEADAKDHPYFEAFQQKLIEADIREYDRRCFWRWLAMANQENGGWMSDYDNFPLALTGEMGLKMERVPGFKTYGGHVPALISADRESWDRVAKLMLDMISPDLDVEIISDMMVLLYLRRNLSQEEMGVSVWKNSIYAGFPYIKEDEESGPKIMCKWADRYLTAHISHASCQKAFKKNTYPKIEGMTIRDTAEKRAEAARIMYRDYQDNCTQ
ncbi:hypothetical protein HJC23_003575 [Cyclotella cryptica]|uniref:Uncharacterized protein n=1 Tax=Cyclotella cryptica TaxID=29204 RepID=A0ABD3NRV3_9STRA|eukprot:CCRYP_020213-RA/>CCRYP_020213-RA protein AED:0.08 eAED:0.08 QI:85/1/1/1/1/1/2/178/327